VRLQFLNLRFEKYDLRITIYEMVSSVEPLIKINLLLDLMIGVHVIS